MATDTGTVLNGWFADLDVLARADARHCLLSGTYSRPLLESLRDVLEEGTGHRRGLDDPHVARPGDPLGANLQTFLRDRLSRPDRASEALLPGQRSRLRRPV